MSNGLCRHRITVACKNPTNVLFTKYAEISSILLTVYYVSIYSLSFDGFCVVLASVLRFIFLSRACRAQIFLSCFLPSFGIEFQIQLSDDLLAISATGTMNTHRIGAVITEANITTNAHLHMVARKIAPHFLPININWP